jgi:hypothetical protein
MRQAKRSAFKLRLHRHVKASSSKYAKAASSSCCVSSRSCLIVVKACASSCFFPVPCSVDFDDLFTLESVMKSCSFCAVASAAFVSASSRAKSDWMTSYMPTTSHSQTACPCKANKGFALFRVKLLQHSECLSQGRLSLLRVLHGCRVRWPFVLSQ